MQQLQGPHSDLFSSKHLHFHFLLFHLITFKQRLQGGTSLRPFLPAVHLPPPARPPLHGRLHQVFCRAVLLPFLPELFSGSHYNFGYILQILGTSIPPPPSFWHPTGDWGQTRLLVERFVCLLGCFQALRLFLCFFICLFVCLSVCLFVCLFVFKSCCLFEVSYIWLLSLSVSMCLLGWNTITFIVCLF